MPRSEHHEPTERVPVNREYLEKLEEYFLDLRDTQDQPWGDDEGLPDHAKYYLPEWQYEQDSDGYILHRTFTRTTVPAGWPHVGFSAQIEPFCFDVFAEQPIGLVSGLAVDEQPSTPEGFKTVISLRSTEDRSLKAVRAGLAIEMYLVDHGLVSPSAQADS